MGGIFRDTLGERRCGSKIAVRPWKPIPPLLKNASFLLTAEVFLLTARLFTYGGGTVSKEDQTQFPDGGNRKQKRPNPLSGRGRTVSKKDQTDFPP